MLAALAMRVVVSSFPDGWLQTITIICCPTAGLAPRVADYENIVQSFQNCRLAALWVCVAVTLVGTPAAAQQQKPNILFILADNVGYGDIGAYGGGELRGAPTPRIDQLASESLRLTQFLVEPGCTPSRAALMTGRYSIRSGLSLVAVVGSPISLPATEITMAEALRDAGYSTAMFGKWHLGAQPYSQPQNKGFDEFYGIPPGDTWDAFLMIGQARHTKSLEVALEKTPVIVNMRTYREFNADNHWEGSSTVGTVTVRF
jgi:arylsulfatase